ncbi:YggT family protein [Candidatus Symbiobacter mobilis]
MMVLPPYSRAIRATFMLFQIVSLLLDVVVGVLSGACLLRMYAQWLRVPLSARSGNPLGGLLVSLTNWIVLPLRRVLPPMGPIDIASLLAAFALQCVEYALLWALAGGATEVWVILLLALFGLLRTAIALLTGIVILYALLSWFPANPALSDFVERLVSPLLAPLRKVIPLAGGIDLSPLIVLVLLQIAAIVLGGLQSAALHG